MSELSLSLWTSVDIDAHPIPCELHDVFSLERAERLWESGYRGGAAGRGKGGKAGRR